MPIIQQQLGHNFLQQNLNEINELRNKQQLRVRRALLTFGQNVRKKPRSNLTFPDD